jgi:hypothetical protein
MLTPLPQYDIPLGWVGMYDAAWGLCNVGKVPEVVSRLLPVFNSGNPGNYAKGGLARRAFPNEKARLLLLELSPSLSSVGPSHRRKPSLLGLLL